MFKAMKLNPSERNLTHVSGPFCCDARVETENGKNCSHLEIHDAAAEQTNHEEDWTRYFKHLELSMMKDVECHYNREEYTND
jgi:hypothetical protein